jgi:hypothetical protein
LSRPPAIPTCSTAAPAAAGGAHGGDRFVFHAGYGLDSITGFARHGAGGTDVIDLQGFGLNFTSLQAYLSDAGGNGVTKGQLQASDFVF